MASKSKKGKTPESLLQKKPLFGVAFFIFGTIIAVYWSVIKIYNYEQKSFK